jgi:hypothetical protein
MKMKMKMKFTLQHYTKISGIPSPPLPSSLSSKIFGHYKEMSEITKLNGQNLGMAFVMNTH